MSLIWGGGPDNRWLHDMPVAEFTHYLQNFNYTEIRGVPKHYRFRGVKMQHMDLQVHILGWWIV